MQWQRLPLFLVPLFSLSVARADPPFPPLPVLWNYLCHANCLQILPYIKSFIFVFQLFLSSQFILLFLFSFIYCFQILLSFIYFTSFSRQLPSNLTIYHVFFFSTVPSFPVCPLFSLLFHLLFSNSTYSSCLLFFFFFFSFLPPSFSFLPSCPASLHALTSWIIPWSSHFFSSDSSTSSILISIYPCIFLHQHCVSIWCANHLHDPDHHTHRLLGILSLSPGISTSSILISVYPASLSSALVCLPALSILFCLATHLHAQHHYIRKPSLSSFFDILLSVHSVSPRTCPHIST